MERKGYKFTCCICGKEIHDQWPNNPWPVCDYGECCEECNDSRVIPERIRRAFDL